VCLCTSVCLCACVCVYEGEQVLMCSGR
jgi:hypothetical protein